MGYRIVRMNGELFAEMMTEGRVIPARLGRRLRVTKGLPEGAKLESMSVELWFLTDQIAMKYSHPSWPDLPPNQPIPILEIEYVVEWDEPGGSDLTPMEELALRRSGG